MSTAEHPDALARRLEQLVAALPEGPAEPAGQAASVAPHVEALHAEMCALRAELASVRAESGAAAQRSEAALEDVRGAVEGRLAVLEDALDGLSERLEALARDGAGTTTSMLQGLDAAVRRLPAVLAARDEELLASLRSGQEQAARDREATQELALAVRGSLDALPSALVDEDARAARRGAALEAGLDRVRTHVTAELAGVRRDLEALTATTERLDAAVGDFRTEWPTRTYEVVQGARAVAEGVVLDVRAEVGARLDDVRATLERVVATVDLARTGLHDGTDRLARAGAVLVAYLEHRDRLLEAERDRVLVDVLDAFAAGLSAAERSALAGRVSDAVARSRDARDAERSREAVGEPVSPTADLPEDVRVLGERVPDPGPVPQPVVRPDREPAPAPSAVPPPTAPVRVVAPPAVARRPAGGSGGSVVVPGPGRSAPPPARRARRSPAPGRGRLGAMPEAPSVDIALDAAASRDDDHR